MNDTENTKSQKEAAGKEWAVLPFDEREDDERWDKLINETAELAKKAAALEPNFDEDLPDDKLSDDAATSKQPYESEDDDLADMNPF